MHTAATRNRHHRRSSRSFRTPQVGRAPSAVKARRNRGSQAQADSAARLPNPPENTRNPPPQDTAEAAPEKARSTEIGGRWWCGGWAARGARCSRSPTSGGGRPTPGPPSATPSSPPSKCSRATASSSPSAPPSPPSSRRGPVIHSAMCSNQGLTGGLSQLNLL